MLNFTLLNYFKNIVHSLSKMLQILQKTGAKYISYHNDISCFHVNVSSSKIKLFLANTSNTRGKLQMWWRELKRRNFGKWHLSQGKSAVAKITGKLWESIDFFQCKRSYPLKSYTNNVHLHHLTSKIKKTNKYNSQFIGKRLDPISFGHRWDKEIWCWANVASTKASTANSSHSWSIKPQLLLVWFQQGA